MAIAVRVLDAATGRTLREYPATNAAEEMVLSENLLVVRVDSERGLLFIRGAVPGPNDGFVQVQSARTPRRQAAAKA